MKFSSVFALATGALALNAGTPTKRDYAAISAAIASISPSLVALDNGINSFSGAGDVASLQALSDAVVAAINNGAQAASASTPLTSAEAFQLAGPVGNLEPQVSGVVNDLIAKKPAFDAAGVSPTVLAALQSQLSATQTFANNLIAKVPEGLVSTAQGLAQPIIDDINRGIAAFQTGTSTSTTSGTATSTGTASNVWAGYGTTTTPVTTTTAGWSGYNSTTKSYSTPATWATYGSSWVEYSTVTYSTSGWNNVVVSTITYTHTSTGWAGYGSTLTTATATAGWAAATVSPSSPVKVWQGAAPKAAAGYGAAGLAAVAAVVAAL